MNIFLSASIPLPARNPEYILTADIVAIRDAIKSMVTEVLPKGRVVFGGHPAITPLIALLLENMDASLGKRVALYQSRFFEKEFIQENEDFFDVRFIDEVLGDRGKSLAEMRRRMFEDTKFDAGVFIGGMEGVEDEYAVFRNMHPSAKLYPIASTGAAAGKIYAEHHDANPELKNELSYPVLFRGIVGEIMNAG